MLQTTAVVIEKSKAERDDIRMRLSHCGVLPICFEDEWVCLENIYCIKPSFAVFRSDSSESASRFVNAAKAIESGFPIIVLSNNHRIEAFVQNNWLENLFFLRYPANHQTFQATINRLANVKQDLSGPVLIAGSVERKKLIQELPLVSASQDPVLIQGESGVGKKLIAKDLHRLSGNPNSIFNLIDAGDVTGEWIRKTKVRIDSLSRDYECFYAIDNAEQLPFEFQAQLFLLLEDRAPGGISKTGAASRFITMVHRDISTMVDKGLFRKDLYHRLSVLKLTVPPLRRHMSDIRALAEYFTTQYSIRYQGAVCRLTDPVMDAFVNYPWPGNVSELKRVIKKLVLMDRVHWENMLPVLCNTDKGGNGGRPSVCGIDTDEVRQFLSTNWNLTLKQARSRFADKVERKIIKAALAETGGNCKKAAGLLRISYKSMLNKAKLYQLV
ncbi:hypothetical protein DSCO28_19240 [Desulfosarcina ovata subsp. sediminis]|uniref:Sigma-54 factor interaction domain-containing protein n=1 Tax=Desulfosarcina ovata subsp. sediminis TaxID=885957 RepID=A0A5K7ZGN3_9BACT|nr:sigma 54-interacting transcriptional regulator [Desulfosarcina ovata]BBO81358.1 hypothetical protein DSCO28_19240 [Desulfosarcina ovata subsp. sediminis]